MKSARVALLLILLPITIQPLSPQQPLTAQRPAAAFPPGNQPISTLQVTARQVVLDVVVTDSRRHPVKGLKPSDFILSEDGVPQTLTSFTERDAADQPPPPTLPVLPPNTFANHAPLINNAAVTVLVFDTSDLPFSDAAYARDEVAAYVKKITPGSPICIFDLDHYGLQLVQDFTTDSSVLRRAVESQRNAQKPSKPAEFTPPLRRGVAMRQLAGYLASFPGRKNLIWFGGYTPPIVIGRPRGLFPDITTFSDDTFAQAVQGLSATLTLNRVALYTVDPRGVVYYQFDQDQSTLASAAPRGSSKVTNMVSNETASPIDYSDVVLQQGADNAPLAAKTGGKAFFNSNAIDKDVAEVVATGSHYYTVSYAPTNPRWNGSFRTIKVQLANNGLTYLASLQPPNQLAPPLHLEYRLGYYATSLARLQALGLPAAGMRQLISYSPKGDPNSSAPATSLDDAMSFGAVAPFQILFNAQIAPTPTTQKLKSAAQLPPGNYLSPKFRHDAYRNYSIHYSVDPQDLQFDQTTVGAYRDTIEFVAVVYDGYGAIVNSFVNTVPLEAGAADFARIQHTGVGIELPIVIPAKGDFYLRLGIHDLNSNRVGALEIPVSSIQLSH